MQARDLISQRWLQFLVLGGLLFALAPPSADRKVEIDGRVLAALQTDHARRLGVPALDAAQARGVETTAIEDEILVREARRLGLDQDDAIVRRRLVQKVLFLAEELGGASRNPTQAELVAFFEKNRERYGAVARIRLVHVLAKTREAAEALRPSVEAFTRATADPDAVPPFGNPLPVPRLVDASSADLARTYGRELAYVGDTLPPGVWSAPVASGYGWHLVRVIERRNERVARVGDIAGALRLDYLVAQREAAVARFIEDAFRRYDVAVDGRAVTHLEPTRRTAPRTQPSLED
jgi:peptidyl-prolyl cis-trans isomerase C